MVERDQFLLKRNDFFFKSFMHIADYETWIVQYICSTLCFCKSLLTSHNCKLTTTNRPWWQWWSFALFNMRCYNFCKITLMQKFALPNLGHVSKKNKMGSLWLLYYLVKTMKLLKNRSINTIFLEACCFVSLISTKHLFLGEKTFKSSN